MTDPRKLGMAFRDGQAFSLGRRFTVQSRLAQDDAKWITVHPNGKGMTKGGEKAKGQPVLIDGETGEVLGGMGGKFTGRHISAVPKRGKEEQHGAQAKIDRLKYLSNNPDLKQKIIESNKIKPEKSQARIQWEQNVEKWKSDLEKQTDKNSYPACCDRLGIAGLTPDNETLIGLNLKSLRILTESVEHIFSKYPQLVEYATNNGGSVRNQYIDENTFATTNGAKITLNPKFFTSTIFLARDAKKMRDLKWTIDFDDKFARKATIYHELGHVLHNMLIREKWENYSKGSQNFDPDSDASYEMRMALIGEHRSAVLDIASKKTGLTKKQLIEQYMSEYGQKTNAEFLAEAFCNLHGGRMNPIGEALGEYLQRKLKND